MKSLSKEVTCMVILLITVFFNINTAYSQFDDGTSTIDSLETKYLDWYNKSPSKNNIIGTEVDRLNEELLSGKKPKTKIIVAVIDAGVDIRHDDLKGKVWVNSDEIPENGTDDDHNGYKDDIHGWNFIGNAQGENIEYETYEEVRIIRKYDSIFKNIKTQEELQADQKDAYLLYTASVTVFNKKLKEHQEIKANLDSFEKKLNSTEDIIRKYLGKECFTQDEVCKIDTDDKEVRKAKALLISKYNRGLTHKKIEEIKKQNNIFLDKNLNLDYNPRSIINDYVDDITDTDYGNNDVIGPTSFHGTMVAGIIAACRNNNIGINGIADSVEIMVIRAVPMGDEMDKDIALAIYYAVDNGARIINMSFGKDFSPDKQFVDSAVKYAEEKNVLLIHGAGNDSRDIDVGPNYPTKILSNGFMAENWIDVGANSWKSGKNLCGSFSNYGKRNVDLFAPGVNIISLSTGNKYSQSDGTSLACPVVSGVAALILSYYPELKATEIKNILLNSTYQPSKRKIYRPNDGKSPLKKVLFSNLSVIGGIVNAYQAFKLAGQISSASDKTP